MAVLSCCNHRAAASQFLFFTCFSLFSLIGLLSASCQRQTPSRLTTENDVQQIVVCLAPTAETRGAVLRVFEWHKTKNWQPKTNLIKVRIGRNGLAWAKGLQAEKLNTPPLKKEGDGKAPQGIFSLIQIFGYAEKPNKKWKMPYLNATKSTLCIDDIDDVNYGKIIDTKKIPSSDKSHETLRRDDNLYQFGIVVDYNHTTPEKGAGSCIFLHVKTPDDQPTSGCTAMTRPELLSVINVLDARKKPVLLQCTTANYPVLAAQYGLPADWTVLMGN